MNSTLKGKELIQSAEEFAKLRTSTDPAKYCRAAAEEAPLAVWLDVIDRFPDFREWVAHNKTVPHEVLDLLAKDADSKVRAVVASRRKLHPELQSLLVRDADPSVRSFRKTAACLQCEMFKRVFTSFDS